MPYTHGACFHGKVKTGTVETRQYVVNLPRILLKGLSERERESY